MCGIFGVENARDAANLTYLGLYALQHRGQESAGIVSWDGERLHAERGMGLVADIFRAKVLARLPGSSAIGHTRYSTTGTSVLANAQPIVVKTSIGPLALVHNGNLVNAAELRRRLEREGSIFQTTSDTEVILHLMARNPRRDVVESLLIALDQVEGAYSLLLLSDQGLIAARDPQGFRPLCLGFLDGHPCFASETCAFDLLGAAAERELELGEVIVSRNGRIDSFRVPRVPDPARCVFEHVYFARPDSQVFGDSVSRTRLAMGAQLAREAPADADVVVPVPDSGLLGALGYSRESGLPFELGLIRNHYVGRTFIEPQQSIRHFGVKVKLNPVRDAITGRRVVLVDDSIVRGTTSRKIVGMVREAGASQVHVRITSPPTRFPCHYGIDTPTREELIAARQDVEEIRSFIGADSLAYLSLDGLFSCLSADRSSYCAACWSGDYRVPVGALGTRQKELFPIRVCEEDRFSGEIP
jgi:amidophosphoribosyltransferase